MLGINQMEVHKIGAFRLNLMPLRGGGIVLAHGAITLKSEN